METIVFGGGCFWCTEAVFKMLRGVESVVPGYAGGRKDNPKYMEVVAGGTGHAEVVKVEYDPKEIRFSDLLTVFFATHDPTIPNRQGNDVGEQYRSIILYTTEAQKEVIEKFIKNINTSSFEGGSVVTEVKPLVKFYRAEERHINYYANNSTRGYCQIVINPKLEKVQEKYQELMKEGYTKES